MNRPQNETPQPSAARLSLRAKNFMAAIISNFGVQALRFFTMTLLARRLGTSLFGAYNYMLLLVSYGFIVVEFGLKNLAIREWAQGRGSGRLISQIFKIRLCLAAGAVAAAVILTRSAFPSAPEYLWPSIYIGASLVVDALLVDFVLIADEALVPQAAGNLVQASLLFFGCYFLVGGEADFMKLGRLFLLSHAAWILVVAWAARKHWKKSPAPDVREMSVWNTAVNGAPFMAATLISGVLVTVDLLLLGQFHFDDWLGDYSAALKILGIALGVINSLLAAVQPRLAKHSAVLDSEETRELVRSTTHFLWMFVVPTVLGCWLFGDELAVIVFGSKFSGAGPLLKPLSLACAFLTLALPPLHLIFVSHQTKTLLKIVAANCVFGAIVIGGILFMNRPEWVAWGMAAVQFVYMLTAWGWYGRWEFISIEEVKAFGLAAAMLAAATFLPVAAPIRLVLTAASYGAGLLAIRIWRRPWFACVLGK